MVDRLTMHSRVVELGDNLVDHRCLEAERSEDSPDSNRAACCSACV